MKGAGSQLKFLRIGLFHLFRSMGIFELHSFNDEFGNAFFRHVRQVDDQVVVMRIGHVEFHVFLDIVLTALGVESVPRPAMLVAMVTAPRRPA